MFRSRSAKGRGEGVCRRMVVPQMAKRKRGRQAFFFVPKFHIPTDGEKSPVHSLGLSPFLAIGTIGIINMLTFMLYLKTNPFFMP